MTSTDHTREETISLEDDTAVALAGPGDSVLDALRDRAGCNVVMRGNELLLVGDPFAVERGMVLVKQLVELIEQGKAVTAEMVSVVDTVSDKPSASPNAGQEVFTDVVITHRGKHIGPKTINQKRYVDAIRENTVTFGVGPAGTGKTYLAMAMAVDALLERRVSRIVLTRPAVEAGERLGFLPGTMLDKIDPYLRPLYDALYDMMEPDKLTALTEQGVIEVAPLAFMRGRTLNDAFIILDEAQNTSPEQMQMFLTRLGFGSRMVVTGDITQVDLPHGKQSGLVVVADILKDLEDIAFIRFDQADVVRHRLVQRIVAAYDAYNARKQRLDGTVRNPVSDR
jgi:phosphate starvation-inducible PhoH-like protein